MVLVDKSLGVMKKGLAFFLGMITGCILTIAILVGIGVYMNKSGVSPDGIEYFAEPGQAMDVQAYEVFQVLPNGNALANMMSNAQLDWYHGGVVLLVAEADSHFYDDQKVKAPKGKRYVQVGTYRYETKGDMVKTVPALSLR